MDMDGVQSYPVLGLEQEHMLEGDICFLAARSTFVCYCDHTKVVGANEENRLRGIWAGEKV